MIVKLRLCGSQRRFGPQGYRFLVHCVPCRPKGRDDLIQGTRKWGAQVDLPSQTKISYSA